MSNPFDFGSIKELFEKSGEITSRLKKIKDELEESRLTCQSGGGMVEVTVNGLGKVVSVKIGEMADLGDRELLEDLIVSAISCAAEKAKEFSKEKMGIFAGGFDMMNLL